MKNSLIPAYLEWQRYRWLNHTLPHLLAESGYKYETAGVMLAAAMVASTAWGYY